MASPWMVFFPAASQPAHLKAAQKDVSTFHPPVLSHPNPLHFCSQLHDELLFEVRAERVAEVASMVVGVMEGAWPLTVPTPTKVAVGRSWGELQETTLEEMCSRQWAAA